MIRVGFAPVMDSQEQEWVERAAAGDRGAFDSLVRLYRPGVLQAARRYVYSPEAVEDVVQDALLQAFRALPNLRETEKFAGWLFAIVRHRAIRVGRSEAASRRVLSLDDQAILETLASPEAPDPDLDAQRLMHGMQELPEEFGRPAILHYLQGWPVAKIAEAYGLTTTTVKWRLHRAREILRASNGENDYGNDD